MKSKALRILLIRRDLNHQLIAERVNFSRPHVTNILNGKRCNPESRRRIGELLGIDLDNYVPIHQKPGRTDTPVCPPKTRTAA